MCTPHGIERSTGSLNSNHADNGYYPAEGIGRCDNGSVGSKCTKCIKVLVVKHCQIRIDWVLGVGKVVNSKLRMELIEEKRDVYGELAEPNEFLIGENLGE